MSTGILCGFTPITFCRKLSRMQAARGLALKRLIKHDLRRASTWKKRSGTKKPKEIRRTTSSVSSVSEASVRSTSSKKKASTSGGATTPLSLKIENNTPRRNSVEGSSSSPKCTANFILMVELRKNIFAFRDMIDLPSLDGSLSVTEIIAHTMKDLQMLSPEIVTINQSFEMEGAEMDKMLIFFYEDLRAIGDSWIMDTDWIYRSKYKNSGVGKNKSDRLVEHVLAALDGLIKTTKERFGMMNLECDGRKSCTSQSVPLEVRRSFRRSVSYSESNNSFYQSPLTPISVNPRTMMMSSSSAASPSLWDLRAQALDKLSPVDLKRFAMHILSTKDSESFTDIDFKNCIEEEEEKLEDMEEIEKDDEGKDHSVQKTEQIEIEDTKHGNETENYCRGFEIEHANETYYHSEHSGTEHEIEAEHHFEDCETEHETEAEHHIKDFEANHIFKTKNHSENSGTDNEISAEHHFKDCETENETKAEHHIKDLGNEHIFETENHSEHSGTDNEIVVEHHFEDCETEHENEAEHHIKDLGKEHIFETENHSEHSETEDDIEVEHHFEGYAPENEIEAQHHIKDFEAEHIFETENHTDTPTPETNTPESSEEEGSVIRLAPPSPPPPPPPPSPPPTIPLLKKKPSPVSQLPPPPPPPSSPEHEHKAPAPPSPPSKTDECDQFSKPQSVNGSSMPTPPAPPGSGKSLRAKKATSKLRRSAQIANLYRVLKGKLEGRDGDGKTKKSSQGKMNAAEKSPAIGAKSGMADALAEMTKRSSYFQQIEEDVEKYAKSIEELKTSIQKFQTKDMKELLEFHSKVESVLEKLTDESQVLAKFEGFPEKKLEVIRTAGALYKKLDGILVELKNWKIEPPVNDLLDKIERYFNKIKGEIETVDRTKDEESRMFKNYNINIDFEVLVQVKETIVDVSSNCMELALKEKREAKEEALNNEESKMANIKEERAKRLWRAFQFAFKVYTFAGGHDERADHLTKQLAHEIQTDPEQIDSSIMS